MHDIKVVLAMVFAQSVDQELFLHDTKIDKRAESADTLFLANKFFLLFFC